MTHFLDESPDEAIDRRRRALCVGAAAGLLPPGAYAADPGREQRAPAQGPASAGSAAPQALRAVNLSPGNYYNSVTPFSDLVRSSGQGWNPDTWTDPQGWLRGLPPGKESQFWVVLHLDRQHGSFAPGRYVARTHAGVTLSLATLDKRWFRDVRGGPGRADFTVAPPPDAAYQTLSIGIRCRNETDRPLDVTDLTLMRVDSDADAPRRPAGGQRSDGRVEFHPDWLAANRGVALVRTMDWAGTNSSPVTTTAQLPSHEDRSWSRSVPYRVQAQAATTLGADLWVCVPHGGQNFRYTCSAETRTFTIANWKGSEPAFRPDSPLVFVDYGQGRASLPKPLEYGETYYAAASRGGSFQVASRPGGPALELESDVGPRSYSRVSNAPALDELSALYEDIARQVAQGLGERGAVYVEYSNEVWNWSFLQAHFARQVLARLGGADAPSASGYGVGCLLAWKAFEKVLGRARVRRTFAAQSAWFENLAPAFDHRDTGLVAKGTSVARLADVYAIAPYVQPANEQGKAMNLQALLAAGATGWRDDDWDRAFDRHIDALSRSVAAHLQKVRARNPQIQVTSYECGQHLAESVPAALEADAVALQRRYLDYLNGKAGAAMYGRYHDQVFAKHGLLHFNHFTDAGGYSSKGHLFQWGLKPSHGSADNPRARFFRSLPGSQR